MTFVTKIRGVVLAEFGSPAELLEAAAKTRQAGYKEFDCHSPFVIHGMDEAMGLKRSPLGFLVFFMGALGLIGAVALMWWTSVIAYPLVFSGKPLFSFQAFVPVAFALTTLVAAMTATIGMIVLNKLPRLSHPIFNSDRFGEFSNDSFFLSIESNDKNYDETKTADFLKSIGGKNIEVLKD